MFALDPWKLILASSSPRRYDLLKQIGWNPMVIKPDFAEIVQPGEKPQQYVLRNASGKLQWLLDNRKLSAKHIIISADTVVVFNEKILEKPRNQLDAIDMLKSLSGNTHEVFTGVCIAAFVPAKKTMFRTGVVQTEVEFKVLSEREINRYCETDEPYDKAGSYAMQGIGSYMVRRIIGSPTNVIGLPMTEVVSWITEIIEN